MIHSITQVNAYTKISMIELIRRAHIYAFATGLTVFYYVIFAANIPPYRLSEYTFAFVGLAILANGIFRFSGQIAMERTLGWYVFLRTMPAPLWTRFAAYTISALLSGAFAALTIIVTGRIYFDFEYAASDLLYLPAVVLFGTAVFAPTGICMGYVLRPASTSFAASFIYLFSALGSGIFTAGRVPISEPWLAQLQPLTIVQQFASAVAGGAPERLFMPLAIGFLWIVATLALAVLAYRRDEGQRFR